MEPEVVALTGLSDRMFANPALHIEGFVGREMQMAYTLPSPTVVLRLSTHKPICAGQCSQRCIKSVAGLFRKARADSDKTKAPPPH